MKSFLILFGNYNKRWTRLLTLTVLVVLFVACQKFDSRLTATVATPAAQPTQTAHSNALISSLPVSTPTREVTPSPLPYEARLIDIHSVNDKILLDIRYATTNNFLKRKLYPVARCVLRGAAAKTLSRVQDDLTKQGLGLKVFDCYRPLAVQKLMWSILPNPDYVANPAFGSRHNRGAAVDVTLVDRNGKALEMPSGFDDFTERSHRDYRGGTPQSLRNRQQLEDAMKKYGFIPLATEWWHFDAPDWDKFSILDIPFGAIP